jgi:hypothetical protein
MEEGETLVIPNKSDLLRMKRDDLIALVQQMGGNQILATEQALQQEIALLREERDKLSAQDAAKDKHLKELEEKLAAASNLAHARRDAMLMQFPYVDYSQPCYRLKWSKRVEGGNYAPADGHINTHVQRGGKDYDVNVLWKKGYTITNDRLLADTLVALGKGISCEPVK